MTEPQPLLPADTAEIEYARAHALQFDGKRQFRLSGEMMAKITASHLLDCLRRAGFVTMKRSSDKSRVAPR